MPPKSNRQSVAQKAELADKVREIKQRQETWFKERQQQEKSRSSPTEGHKTTGVPRSIVRQTHTIRKGTDPARSPVPVLPDTTDTSAVRSGGFKTYLQNKQRSERLNNSSSPSGSHDSLTVDSSISDEQQQRFLSRTHQRSLSPEMFDTLADQIINKVKRELRMDGVNGEVTQNGEVEEPRSRSRGTPTGQKLSSHHCQICSEIMLSPSCSPQLLIPCGHTFCAGCVRERSRCPGCEMPVQSVTPNLMLQQVIAEYAENRPQSGQPGRGTPTRTASRNHTPKPKVRDLSGEYDTLTVRCEVLEAEAEDIQARMAELEERVQGKLRMAEQVEHKQQRIEQQIEQLREQQRLLETDREGILEESEGLRDLVQEEESKLNMVTCTIRGLRKDMDKIKRLANGTPR